MGKGKGKGKVRWQLRRGGYVPSVEGDSCATVGEGRTIFFFEFCFIFFLLFIVLK